MKRLLILLLLVGCTEYIPLEVTIEGTKEGFIPFTANLTCTAMNGTGEYNYEWQIKEIYFDEKKNETISCTVSDGEIEVTSYFTIEAKKEIFDIKSIAVMGDSLTEGFGSNFSWADILAETFDAKLENTAQSGDTTYQTLSKITHDADLTFIWIGANDIKKFHTLEEFERNYREIVSKVENPILMTIPDASKLQVAEDIENIINNLGFNIPVRIITADVMKQYNDIIYQIADENNLRVIDMYSFMEKIDDSLLLNDRVHPNEEGHILIAQKVNKELYYFYEYKELI